MDKVDLETTKEQIDRIENKFPEDTVLAMPIGFNWIFDVPTHVLEDYIMLIQKAIEARKEYEK